MSKTEIREAPNGLWLKPSGWDYSAIFVNKPYNAEGNELLPMPIPIPAGVDIESRKRMTPDQARALGRALITAAERCESMQQEFDKEQPCTKPKPGIS